MPLGCPPPAVAYALRVGPMVLWERSVIHGRAIGHIATILPKGTSRLRGLRRHLPLVPPLKIPVPPAPTILIVIVRETNPRPLTPILSAYSQVCPSALS